MRRLASFSAPVALQDASKLLAPAAPSHSHKMQGALCSALWATRDGGTQQGAPLAEIAQARSRAAGPDGWDWPTLSVAATPEA